MAHEALLRGKYDGEITADDPAFARLSKELPELRRYYELLASRIP